MSAVDHNINFVKLKKKKKRDCSIVGCCLFVGIILLSLSNGGFEESKLYGAPTDHCMFTNASSTTDDCRHDTGCNGLQRTFYYNTTGGTCTTNELYDYSECDCSDNPATTPHHGYQSSDKCWIQSCESHKDWTFIEPVNEKAQAWIALIIGLPLTVFGIVYCCKCIQTEIDYDGASVIQEIGEKEAYIRFYKKIDSKETTDSPSSWKTLHIVVLSISIAVPIILIGAFLIATYSYGANVNDNTISTGIQYRREYNGMFRFTEAMTMLSVILASFVSWCRQIQISVYFREYAAYFGAKQAKLYRWLNVIAMIFNVIGYFAILELVSYDSARMTTAHAYWAAVAFFSTAAFLLLTTIITIKQRYIEYRRYRTVEEQSPYVAMKHTFWYDAVVMLILFLSGAISLFVFFGEIIKANIRRNKVPEEEREDVFDYIGVFTGEWVAFFSLVSGIAAVALNFHHDHIAWEIHDYLQKEVKLWPCSNCVFDCLGCCCCCCIEVEQLKAEIKHHTENEVEDKAQNDGKEMNEVDDGNENDGNNETMGEKEDKSDDLI